MSQIFSEWFVSPYETNVTNLCIMLVLWVTVNY